MSVEPKTCRYIDLSSVQELIAEYLPAFDGDELEARLRNVVMWGDGAHTLVRMSVICDAIRKMNASDDQCDAVAQLVSNSIPYDVFIDLEN